MIFLTISLNFNSFSFCMLTKDDINIKSCTQALQLIISLKLSKVTDIT